MKLSLHLTPRGGEKLNELLQANDRRLLSALHKLGVTELQSGVETFEISPQLTFMEKFRAMLGFPPRFRVRSKAACAPERALEILGMLIEARQAIGTTVKTRFIVALERAAERGDMNALELLAGALPSKEMLTASNVWLFKTDLLQTAEVGESAIVVKAEASREKRLVAAFDGDAEAVQKIAVALHSPVSGVRTLLEAVSASPLAQAELHRTISYLDSMQSASFQSSDSGSSADAIVIVREAVKQLAELTEQGVPAIQRALGQWASIALSPLPELRWRLRQGPVGIGSSGFGDLLPEGLDVAWDLLTSFALTAVAHGEATAPEKARTMERGARSFEGQKKLLIKSETSFFRYVTYALDYVKAGMSELSLQVTPLTNEPSEILHLSKQLQVVRESGVLRDDEMLKLRIGARVVASEGNLNWYDCLTLANARARYHYFFDADAPTTQTDLPHKVTSHKGGLVVHVLVRERRLPVRFREHYERQKLYGRIQVLSELVEFAKREHTTPIQISSEEIAKRTEIADEELLRRIRKKTN